MNFVYLFIALFDQMIKSAVKGLGPSKRCTYDGKPPKRKQPKRKPSLFADPNFVIVHDDYDYPGWIDRAYDRAYELRRLYDYPGANDWPGDNFDNDCNGSVYDPYP